jgi:alpha-D-ribose 1-methylphosphonate 5-triphosphate synthase subunit PhnH
MLEPGFADPVAASQTVFRALLSAMSEPGRVLALPPLLAASVQPGSAARALLLTLADGATPIWLDAAARPAADALRFHTGAPITDTPAAASFALVADAALCPPLAAFSAGDEAFPDRSCTLIIELPRLAEGGERRLAGPGIDGARWLTADGLRAGFWAEWAANHARFPAGIDVILTSGHHLAALPRTVSEAACTSR